ncbi:MFS transporter [Actinomycetes bacterium KLBMP 9797]
MCLSLIVVGLDVLIITMALPSAQKDLDASGSQLQWSVDAYTLAFGGLILIGGGLADRLGRKRVFLAGLVVLLAFSVAAAFAPSAGALIAFRAGMGVGSALIMPATLSLIKHVFPPHEQAKAMGLWVGAASLGLPLGPVLGGVLLSHFWWGSVFLVNVPVVGAALFLGWALIPGARQERHSPLDLVGVLLSLAGMVSLVYGVIEGPQHGWTSPLTVGLLVAGAGLLAVFIWWERHTPHPMLNRAVFEDRRFGGPVVTIGAGAFAMFGGLFVMTQYLQFTMGYTPLEAGLRLLFCCTIVLSAPIAPMLVERLGLKPVAITGLLCVALALVLLPGASTGSDTLALASLALVGFGLGFVLPPSTNSIMEATPAHQAGAGSAVADVAMQVGGALGVAVMGSVLTTAYRDGLPDLAALPAAAGEAARGSIGGALAAADQLGGAAGADLALAAREAFVAALGEAALVGVAVCLVGGLLAAFALPRRRQQAAPVSVAPVDEPRTADPVPR